MTDYRPMSGAEFRCLREHLGVNTKWMTARLEINERTLLRWEFGRNSVREFAVAALVEIARDADELAAQLAADAQRTGDPVRTYRNDEEFHAEHPDSPYPASWHRAAAFRAARKVGAELEYRGMVD